MREKAIFFVSLICFGTLNTALYAQTVSTEMMAQGEIEENVPENEEQSQEEKKTAAEKTEISEPSPPPASATLQLNLEQAQRMAVRNNQNIKNIDEVIYQADVLILSAWSMLLPNISANGAISRNNQEIAVDFPNPNSGKIDQIVVQDLWSKSFGFSVNMAIFNPRSIPAIKMAYDDTTRTRLEAQIKKNELLFAVTSSYYQINSLKELIGVHEENLKVAKEFQKRSEALKKAGQTTNIDVLRAQIEVMDAERQLADTQDSLVMAKKALAYMVGIEGDYETAANEPVTFGGGSVEELKEKALAKRAELESATVSKRIAERAEREMWMRWLPSFDVTYNWNWNSAGGFAEEKDSWMLIFGAKWSLLEGGSRIAEMKKRKSNTRMAENEIRNLELGIKQEVDEDFLEVKRRRRNLEYTEKKVALAEENHHLVNRQYQVGLVSSLDVVEATSRLAASRINQVVERMQYELAVLTLKKSAGDYHDLAVVEQKGGGMFGSYE